MEILETYDDGQYRVVLEADNCSENPRRDYDHLVHVITLGGQRYIDVDPDGGPLEYGWDHFSGRNDAVELFIRWARIFHGATVVEHRPTEGARSLWYILPREIAGGDSAPLGLFIGAEIAEYQAWADGEVYGYIIEKAVERERLDNMDNTQTLWEEVDSCWGFFGYEVAAEAARSEFKKYNIRQR